MSYHRHPRHRRADAAADREHGADRRHDRGQRAIERRLCLHGAVPRPGARWHVPLGRFLPRHLLQHPRDVPAESPLSRQYAADRVQPLRPPLPRAGLRGGADPAPLVRADSPRRPAAAPRPPLAAPGGARLLGGADQHLRARPHGARTEPHDHAARRRRVVPRPLAGALAGPLADARGGDRGEPHLRERPGALARVPDRDVAPRLPRRPAVCHLGGGRGDRGPPLRLLPGPPLRARLGQRGGQVADPRPGDPADDPRSAAVARLLAPARGGDRPRQHRAGPARAGAPLARATDRRAAPRPP